MVHSVVYHWYMSHAGGYMYLSLPLYIYIYTIMITIIIIIINIYIYIYMIDVAFTRRGKHIAEV